jgi:hypothetical protein
VTPSGETEEENRNPQSRQYKSYVRTRHLLISTLRHFHFSQLAQFRDMLMVSKLYDGVNVRSPCWTLYTNHHIHLQKWFYSTNFMKHTHSWKSSVYSVAFSPQANSTDLGTATCWRNLVPNFADRWVSRGQHSGSPTVVNLSCLVWSRYFYFKYLLIYPHKG